MSYYQGDADLPPGYSSRYSPPPLDQRPPSPGPPQRDAGGGPVVYDYSHGGGGGGGGGVDGRRGRGPPGRPPSPVGGGSYAAYPPGDVKPNVDRYTGVVVDARRDVRPGYEHKSRRPRSPGEPHYPSSPSLQRRPPPADGKYSTPPPPHDRGGGHPPPPHDRGGGHHQSRGRHRPVEAAPSPPAHSRRRIPSPTELYGPPPQDPVLDRYGAPARRDDRFDHGRRAGPGGHSPSPPSHPRRRSPPSPRRMRPAEPHHPAAGDGFFPDPGGRDPAYPPPRGAPPPMRYERDRSPLPPHHPPPRGPSPVPREPWPPRSGIEESPMHRKKTNRNSPPPRDFYHQSSPAPFDAPPIRRASPPPQAYRDPGPYSPPPPQPATRRRLTPSPYRTPSPPEREAFGHNLDNLRGDRSPLPRERVPEQFRENMNRDSREKIPPEQFRNEYERGVSPPPQYKGHQHQQLPPPKKMPRSPSGSPLRHQKEPRPHHHRPEDYPSGPGAPAKRARSPSLEKPAAYDPDYPEGICKEWFDTGVCRKPIGGCFMAHSLPESPQSKHRRKKYTEKESAGAHQRRDSRERHHVDDPERAARKAEKRAASAHANHRAPGGEDPYAEPAHAQPPHARPPPEAEAAFRRERQTEEERKESKKLCREWAVGACDSANKKCRRRHYFINDEADYYNDISAAAGALPKDPPLNEEESEWQNWLNDQTRSWQVQKRVNEQRAEEDRRAGQSDAATAIMRRQMEEYQQQMQTWMVEMNDWMKTQSLTDEKMKEMRQMIKQQMEQVRQVAQSAQFMAAHGPGSVPGPGQGPGAVPGVVPGSGPPETSSATSDAANQHSLAPPAFAAPGAAIQGSGAGPPKVSQMASSISGAAPGSQPLRPEGLGFPTPHGLPPFDPLRPPPMFQPGRGPPPQALPPNFQPHNPPPGFRPIGVNTAAPSPGAPMQSPLGSPPPAAPTKTISDGANETAPVDGADIPQKYKPCFSFRRGKCPLTEESCPYSHNIARIDKPCFAYNQAACRFDADCCTYQHVCKNCGGPEPAVNCGCGSELKPPDKLSPGMVERLKKRFYWKEMEKIAKQRGEKGGIWRNNRSPSPEICGKWNDKGLDHCPVKTGCRYLHRCKSCWGPDPYVNCTHCNTNAKSGGAKACPDFPTAAGCPRGFSCPMTHHCSTCKATFLEHSGDCRCGAPPIPADSDAERGCPKSKAEDADAADGESGGVVVVKFVKEERQDGASNEFPKDVCRMFNLGICKNPGCPQQHKCAKCLKIGLNLMSCNCTGAKDFRETISSGIKKDEPKKPDLPLGGCIKFNLGSCEKKCDVGHHCAICLGKNAAKICACQGAKDLRKALVTLEEMQSRKTKKNLVRLEKRGWPDRICRNFNVGTCAKTDCSKTHACVKCSSSSPITTCSCEGAIEFQKDVTGAKTAMDNITAKVKARPDKSTDLNFARGGWPRGVCKNFNAGTCPFPTCKYFHKCAKCLGSDPMQTCACFGGEDFRENPTLEREMMDALTLYDLNISTLLSCAQKVKADEARIARGEPVEEETEEDTDDDGWRYVRDVCHAYNHGPGCSGGVKCEKRHVCLDCLGPYPKSKCPKCKGSIKAKFVCKEFQTGQCLRGGRCPFPHRCHACQGPIPRAKCSSCVSKLGPYPPPMRKSRPPHAEGRPPHSEGRPPHGEGRPPYSEGRPPHGEGRPPYSEGRPPHAEGRPPYSEGRPPHAEGRPPYGEGRPPHAEGRPPYGDGRPPYGEGRPPNGEGRPVHDGRPPLEARPPHHEAHPVNHGPPRPSLPVGGPFRPPPMSHAPPASSILGPFPGTPGILGPAPSFLRGPPPAVAGGPPPVAGGPPPTAPMMGGGPPRGLTSTGPPHVGVTRPPLQPPTMMDADSVIRPNGAGFLPTQPGGTHVQPQRRITDSQLHSGRPTHPNYNNDGDDDDGGAEPERPAYEDGALPEENNGTAMDFTRDDVDPSRAVGFANDGSFAEFAQGVIQQKQKEQVKQGTPQPTGLNKRVGGKALKTGMVMKPKKPEDKPKDGVKDDAWSKYMQEVKKMSGNVCERGSGGNSSLAQ